MGVYAFLYEQTPTTNCCVIFLELFHLILFKVELLLEIEESLPKWILRRVQVDKHEEFPNRSSKLQTKVRNSIRKSSFKFSLPSLL